MGGKKKEHQDRKQEIDTNTWGKDERGRERERQRRKGKEKGEKNSVGTG